MKQTGYLAALPLLALMMLPVWAAPHTASAQEPLGRVERPHEVRLFAARAQLGVRLGPAAQVGDRIGVRVRDVVAGGPAARAGIQADDIILSLDGHPLGAEPAARLTALMAEVTPGDTVVVVVHREGQDRSLQVVTDRRGLVLRPGVDPRPGIEELLRDRMVFTLPSMALGRHRLELVDMNPGLGRYFGAETGVLVVNVADESTLGLEPGDVILAIDGRTVRDRRHALAILASYRGDEEVELRLVRDRGTITVRGTPGARR